MKLACRRWWPSCRDKFSRANSLFDKEMLKVSIGDESGTNCLMSRDNVAIELSLEKSHSAPLTVKLGSISFWARRKVHPTLSHHCPTLSHIAVGYCGKEGHEMHEVSAQRLTYGNGTDTACNRLNIYINLLHIAQNYSSGESRDLDAMIPAVASATQSAHCSSLSTYNAPSTITAREL